MKRLLVFILAATLCACSVFQSAEAKTAKQAADVFNGTVSALEILDAASVKSFEALPHPTVDDVLRMKSDALRLKSAHDALLDVRRALDEGDLLRAGEKLAAVLIDLEVVKDELQARGVEVPKEVDDALDAAQALLGHVPSKS